MDFKFTGCGLAGKEQKIQRLFEILPGFLSWSILVGMAVFAFLHPLGAALVIIAFYFYWLLRMIYLTLFLLISYFRLSGERQTNWLKRAKELDSADDYLEKLNTSPKPRGLKNKLSFYLHRDEVRKLILSDSRRPHLSDIYHLVIIPVVKESREIFEPGIKSLLEGTFPSEKILVVIALEERAIEQVTQQVEAVSNEYRDKFMDIIVSVHPDGVLGEAKVKGANTTFAAKKAAEYLKEKGIKFENVISSCFDADTVVNPNYFACLAYSFIVTPDRTRASFQPVPVYNNNIWDAPGITRVLETGSSFFQLVEATNPEKLVTFSSHSMSFKALVDVGYWPVDMISDDSAIFWKAFVYYDGDYRVVPIYTTLSMDAVVAENTWKTVINVYKQKRRWAWGVENFPIVMRAFLKRSKISLYNRLRYLFKLLEGHISWTTWAFLLTIIGWLPAFFAKHDYSHSVVYYSVPRITGVIFHLASFSLITSIVLSLCLLPKKKERHAILKRIGFACQWLLMPFTIIFLSALPALDAQTRLMFGKYMTFWVTDKTTKK